MKLTRRHFVTSSAVWCAASTLRPAFSARANQPELQAETLADGTRLVVLTDRRTPEVALDVFFRVGLADEGSASGIRSLLARSWIGEAEFRSAPLLFSDIRRFGGGIGTDVGDDWTEIWSVGSSDPDRVRAQMQTVLTNLVSRPVFSAQNVDTAKREQQRALLLAEDDLWTRVTNELRNRAWGTSASSRSALGDAQTVDRIKPAPLAAFYQTYFRPDRAVVVVAGDIDFETAKQRVTASLGAGGWDQVGSRSPKPRPLVQDRIAPNLRTRLVTRRAPATIVAVGLLAPGTETGRTDWAALLLVDAILGQGKASRLFALRDVDAQAYDVRTRLISGRAQSLWGVFAIGDAPQGETAQKINAVLDAWKTGEKPATEGELERAKQLLITRHLSDRQRLRDRAWGLGWAETMGLTAEWEMAYAARLQAVTLGDVNRVAHAILSGNRAVVQSLGPATE